MTDGAPALVQDLLRPRAYALPDAAPISLRSTHASWVFLAGDDVWKVKRPVSLGFLDFRTTEARRHYCEEEIRLNRRLAPDVYLGVEPVRMTPAGHSLVGDGPVVDWAVHMRRLPDDASAEARIAGGQLDASLLEKLARRLVAFFGAAQSSPAFGTPEVLEASVAENFSQVEPFVGDLLEHRTLVDVGAFQIYQLVEQREVFAARVAQGRVREGHGDLRLEHVYFLPDGEADPAPAIIDCVEFNDRFRCGDVASEIAFLAMELAAARRPDLAAGFVARFAEASHDFGLYTVLDFYLSYRAWVRGKVAAFLAADHSLAADVRSKKRDEARRDFALARSFAARPRDRPFLVAVGGVIGSGKSTLAAALGRALAAPVVSSDLTRKLNADIAPTARGGPSPYDPEHTERTYAEIIRLATCVLASGRGVILDATFSARRWRQVAAATARVVDAEFAFVEARCARPELVRRLAARQHAESVSDATDDLLDSFLQRYEPLNSLDPGPRFTVDTSGPTAETVEQAVRHLAGVRILAAADRQAL